MSDSTEFQVLSFLQYANKNIKGIRPLKLITFKIQEPALQKHIYSY